MQQLGCHAQVNIGRHCVPVWFEPLHGQQATHSKHTSGQVTPTGWSSWLLHLQAMPWLVVVWCTNLGSGSYWQPDASSCSKRRFMKA